MAIVWVATGTDEYGNETGYNWDDGTGETYDDSGNYLGVVDSYDDYAQSADSGSDAHLYNNPSLGGISPGSTTSDWLGNLTSGVTGSSILDTLKSFIQTNGTYDKAKISGILAALGGADALSGGKILGGLGGSSSAQPVGYQGGIPKYTAHRMQMAQPQRGADEVLRAGVTGGRKFSDVAMTKAASGGLMALAVGGSTGTYLRGETDGMADELPASIEGEQPAALSHGEFVLPADVVSHLGNGNSDAGAKKLYAMMDKVRMARTGSKQQGKEIDPDKFMPGGAVPTDRRACGGGIKRLAEGGTTTPTVGTESNLSSWAGPYVTDMLGQAQALASMPYEAYQGPLTAGASNLQQQGFQQAANLQPSPYLGQAAQTAGGIASAAQNMQYNPTQYGSTYQGTAPYQAGTFGNQFSSPGVSAATNFSNQFSAPGAYQAGNITSQNFGTQQAQQYMNPYLQSALSPQLQEMRRQAQITQMGNDAKMVGAGAFGGDRQALMTSENQRNLMNSMESALGTGYKNAYDAATSQFNADQGRNLTAQQATEQSRQFGAGQSMTAAQLQAQYGMSAQQAQEAARQFNQGQAMSAAQLQAQYGLSAQQAQEASRQFGANYGLSNAQNAAQFGQAANALNAQNQQFGANYGLQGLNTALQAAQAQGSLGAQQSQQGLANLSALMGAGAVQRDITQQGYTADQAAFNAERDNPYKMLQFQQSMLQGMPVAAQQVTQAQPSLLQQLAAMGAFGTQLTDILNGTTTPTTAG